MSPDTLPDTRDARPRLSERHNAMLRTMGVNVWWDQAAPQALATPAPAARPVRSDIPHAEAPQQAPTSPPATARASVIPVHPVPSVARAADPATAGLDREALEAAIRACQRCDLGHGRRHAVPGMGDPAPDWLIVGEAPGEEEDRQGLPFVGRAGQLLDRMLAAMQLSREQKVYIANVIKCRPPHNRNPSPVEVDQCSPYLLRQVELLRPRIVLAMGRFAAQTVLGQGGCLPPETLQQMPLGKLRGQVYTAQLGGLKLPVVVTYHPAYLLRSPADKGKAWADLCLALRTLEHLPSRA